MKQQIVTKKMRQSGNESCSVFFRKKSVKINRSVGNLFSAKSISDYLKSEHHSIDNETLSKNAANALANFCICFVKKCHTLQMDFSYFEYGRKQSFHTFFIANPK